MVKRTSTFLKQLKLDKYKITNPIFFQLLSCHHVFQKIHWTQLLFTLEMKAGGGAPPKIFLNETHTQKGTFEHLIYISVWYKNKSM